MIRPIVYNYTAPYHYPKSHPGLSVVRECGEGQTDTETCVTNIHFASATPYAKYNPAERLAALADQKTLSRWWGSCGHPGSEFLDSLDKNSWRWPHKQRQLKTCEFLNSENNVKRRCSDCIRDLWTGMSSNPATQDNANGYRITAETRRHSKSSNLRQAYSAI